MCVCNYELYSSIRKGGMSNAVMITLCFLLGRPKAEEYHKLAIINIKNTYESREELLQETNNTLKGTPATATFEHE
jgi:hypothetical protein